LRPALTPLFSAQVEFRRGSNEYPSNFQWIYDLPSITLKERELRNVDNMDKRFLKILSGYENFRDKYVHGDNSVLQYLSDYGQRPQIMVVACCDSRVDPALIFQCDPGDLFVVRNVANIVPPYEKDDLHHGTSAALEFGVKSLKINNLILLGHSQCGGIQALLHSHHHPDDELHQNDFINNWVSLVETEQIDRVSPSDPDQYAKLALKKSYENCLTFPWLKEKIVSNKLIVHQWFFDIKLGQIFAYSEKKKQYIPLNTQEIQSDGLVFNSNFP
jgi:carbonic anhydrase